MFEDGDLLDPSLICRDEDCEIDGVHRKHLVQPSKSRPHHRPKRTGRSLKPPWQQDDREGLRMSVERAAANGLPMYPSAIVRDVRDDYGTVHERTVYRYLRNSVLTGRVLKLDLKLPFAVYLSPNSALLHDLASVREYMVAVVDGVPTVKKRRAAEGE
jgi:hypothetical protein